MDTGFPTHSSSDEDLASQLEYDRSAPLQIEEHGQEQKRGATIQDISYASPGHGRIRAYWVQPDRDGPRPGVIFAHPAPGDRSTFLDEAVELASHGIASLLVELPWAQGQAWGMTMGEAGHDREEFRRTALDLRRAVDVLASRPGMAAGRLGFVGHSLGALFGGLLSGLEPSLQAYILMAGVGRFSDLMALNLPGLEGEEREKYGQALAALDPAAHVGRAAPAALYFQFGRRDDSFPRQTFEAFAAAASEPKQVRWYDTDHFFAGDPAAQKDRREWLLGLS